VGREDGLIKESFTLVLPPQAYTIKEPQRVSITKTFGNAFVDDYGPDNIQITIKGISGTAHAFPTFTTAGVARDFSDVSLTASQAARLESWTGYTGRSAFYIFRNTIIRYKDNAGWEKRELRVYDLADEQAYKCVLLDFTLDRSSEQPHHYPFTISLFVYQRLDKLTPKLKAIKISKDPWSALNHIDSLMNRIEQAYQGVGDIINQVALMKAGALELRTRYSRFLAQTTRIITSPLNIAKNLVDTGFMSLHVAYTTYRAGKYTRERYMGVNELFRAAVNEGLKIYGFQISEGLQESKTETIEGDDGVSIPEDATAAVSRVVDSRSYEFSGLNVYTVKGDDTLQRIAQSELGDTDLWPYIAAVNSGIGSNDDLVPGIEIFIPVQVEPSEGINKEQFILTEDAARNPYGSDMLIDGNGDLVIQESSDFALVSGTENVKQAINLRLNTMLGSMIKQSAYGITAQAGFAGTTMAIRYLKLAVRATVVQDPRVESVDNMVVLLRSDTLHIGMDIGIIGIEQSLPVTLIM